MKYNILITIIAGLFFTSLMGCIVAQVDCFWTGTLSIQIVDGKTRKGVEGLQLSLSTPNNIIGRTDSAGVCIADIAVFWGYKEQHGVFGFKNHTLVDPILYIYIYCNATNYTSIQVPLSKGNQYSKIYILLEITDDTCDNIAIIDTKYQKIS